MVNPTQILGGRGRVGRAHLRNTTTNANTRRGGAEAAPYRSPRTGVNLRRALRVGAWNIRSLSETERLPLLSLELKKLGIAIAALSEVRWPGSGENSEGGYTYYYSGRSDGKRTEGVAVAVADRFLSSVAKVTPVDERIMLVRLKHTLGFISLVAVYAPTEKSKLGNKEMFYTKLESILDQCPPGDTLLVLGDFNAVTGTQRDGYEVCLGPHGSGTRNVNSSFLLDFARSRRLRIAGSWYQRPKLRRWTWYSNDGQTRKEIDHILISTRWRLLQNCRVFRSAEFPTDHRLVVATLKLRLRSRRVSRSTQPRLHLEKLKDEECAREYAVAVSNRFEVLDTLQDPEELWDTFKRETLSAAGECLGARPRSRRGFISGETLDKIEESRAARLAGDLEQHRNLTRSTRASLRRDKERYVRGIAEEVEGHFRANDLSPAYRALKKLRSKSTSQVSSVYAADGRRLVSDPDEYRARWAEYFEQLYMADPPTQQLPVAVALPPVPIPQINEDAPSIAEVRMAVSKLKSGKAAGVCGIPGELLKEGGEGMIQGLHRVLTAVWQTGTIPPDWKRGLVTPIWKGKGDRRDCGNYRGITLLSVPGKVLAHLLLMRVRDHLLRTQRPEQSGFTPKKSTIDRILALRILVERRREVQQGTLASYVDLKKAFDSVHRETLWELLRLRGIPAGIIGLMSGLYSDTESAVKCGGSISDFFPVTTGVRQGCVIAPTLFNVCMDWVLGRSVEGSSCGTSIGNFKLTDLDFADDAVIFAETLEVLELALEALHEETKPLGLKVSWTKTKIQDFGNLLGPDTQSVHVCGEDIEVVESFTYLGSAVHNTMESCGEVNRRLGMAYGVMDSLNKSIWRCRYLSRRTKVRVFKSLVLPVFLYGSETWTLSKALKRRINAFGTRCLRRVMGYTWRDRVSNEVLLRETDSRYLVRQIQERQLRLYGHVARLPADDPAHGVIAAANNPEWRRPVGRPRLAWLKQVDEVCRELLGIGRVQAWELARRSPGEWSRRVGEATRRHGVRPT